jgi:hypothetical protein
MVYNKIKIKYNFIILRYTVNIRHSLFGTRKISDIQCELVDTF